MTRIFVADDSETIVLLLRTRLEMEGYEVTTARDGEEAMEKLSGGKSGDVILLDAMMPRKSGFDVLGELRSHGDRRPVLIVSAHQSGGDANATNVEPDGYISKPIDFDDLLSRIRALSADAPG
jgi:two-component system response regulator MprA